jgi:hypothetical protein
MHRQVNRFMRRGKYNAVKQNGYDSKMEAHAGGDLEIAMKAGLIRGYERQKSVDLVVNGHLVCKWRVDFLVTRADGTQFYYEIKGMPTRDYEIKRKLFLAIYPTAELWINHERVSRVGRDRKF